jgi:hypothetical protein
MIKQEFIDHTKTVRAWIIAMIASWDDLEKITNLILKYVGNPELKLFNEKVDSWFIAQFPEMNIIGIDGTKNIPAWISNLDGFGTYFHDGIFDATHDTILPECAIIKNTRKNTLIAGQSRGGLIALFLNYLLKGQGYQNVESFGFANPFGTTNAGTENMRKFGIRHTNFVTDAFGSIPSDPTDDVGVIGGGHYGHVETLYGGAGVFDHSYLNITLKLSAWLLRQYDEKHDEKLLRDAVFLAKMADKGNDLIKK